MTYTPDFVYITTLNGLEDMYMVKPLLDEVSITYYIKNENLIALNPFYSNATGGLDLMVKADEVELARRILYDAGYLADPDPTFVYDGAAWLTKTYAKFKDHPLFKRFGFFTTIVGGLVIVLGLIIGYWVYADATEVIEVDITGRIWCVQAMYYNGQEVTPKTNATRLVIEGCEETVDMGNNDTIWLPGMNTEKIKAYYFIKDGMLTIKNATKFGTIYNGTYNIAFENNNRNVVLTGYLTEIRLRTTF